MSADCSRLCCRPSIQFYRLAITVRLTLDNRRLSFQNSDYGILQFIRTVLFYHLVEYIRLAMTHHQEPTLDKVYGAIADPTRRAILALLKDGDANVGTLVEQFPISFNGVSKHIKVLESAGLISRTVHGREHRIRIQAAPLREAADWLEHYRAFWNERLDALESLLITNARKAKKPRSK
jgi:DNA-binding transcriptional ArsR family regulator